MKPLIGMYVHMHWGFNHPYAARTWTLDDWRNYLRGISLLGYNLVQIWPMIDTMPAKPTASDEAHLAKLAKVIDLAHEEYGLIVYVGAGANTMGNPAAYLHTFEERPYFLTESLVNPALPGAVAHLMETRRRLLEPLKHADGFWILDSDPGGFHGAPQGALADLFLEHRHLLDSLRPGIKLIYWMWSGWGHMEFTPEWMDNPQNPWRQTLRGIAERDPAPWGVHACWKGHFSVLEELGLLDRALYCPYNTVEQEPSFPLTTWRPQPGEALPDAFTAITRDLYAAGALGNSQSHCLQLPHLYLFHHLASGESLATADLARFAHRLIPGAGDLIAQAWEAMSGHDIPTLESVRDGIHRLEQEELEAGDLNCLLLGNPGRFLEDLRLQTELIAALEHLTSALHQGGDVDTALRVFHRAFTVWQTRTGFDDRAAGPFMERLAMVLATVCPEGLKELQGVRHGAMTALRRVLSVRPDMV